MYNLHTILAKLFRRVSVTRSQICCFPLLDPSEKKTNYMPWQHIFSVFLSRRVDVKCIIYEGTELNRRYSIRPSAGTSVENWAGWDQLGWGWMATMDTWQWVFGDTDAPSSVDAAVKFSTFPSRWFFRRLVEENDLCIQLHLVHRWRWQFIIVILCFVLHFQCNWKCGADLVMATVRY